MLQSKLKDPINSNEEFNFLNISTSNNQNNTNIHNTNNNEITNNLDESNIFNIDSNSQTGVLSLQNIQYNYMVMDSLLLRTTDEDQNFTKYNLKNNGNNISKSNLNVENDPRVLTFTTKNRSGTAKNNTVNYIYKMKSIGEKNENYGKNNKKVGDRFISKTPERILDAPNLIDDYYLNLLDWSKNNVVAVGLGNLIYVHFFD